MNAGFSPGWRPNLLLSGVAGLRSGILSDARPLSGMGISVRCVAALLNSLSITSSPFLQVVIQHSTILSYSAIHAIRRSMGDIPQASGKRNFVSISAISRCMCLLRSSVTGSVSREKRCIPDTLYDTRWSRATPKMPQKPGYPVPGHQDDNLVS